MLSEKSKRRLTDAAVCLGIFVCCCFLVAALAYPALAHDHRLANADWYKSQVINPEAQLRTQLGYKSCCDAADHFDTRFRLVNDGTKYGVETYDYWTGDKWKAISADIIQRKKTPDGRPVLFIIKGTGKEVCFIIDDEGDLLTASQYLNGGAPKSCAACGEPFKLHGSHLRAWHGQDGHYCSPDCEADALAAHEIARKRAN